MEFMIGYQKAILIEGVVQLVVSMAKLLILVGGVLVVIGTYPEAFLMKSMGIVLKKSGKDMYWSKFKFSERISEK